ncbi:MAG: alpha/beta hydrolase [Nitrospirae bacterium]|nr:alpha/beta hydrolase [Nitrospirota bacterium]
MSLLDQFFVYHPEPWQDRDWAKLSGLPLEDIWFQAADGARLFGWYVEAAADRPVILWCHGNAGNVINRLENLKLLYQLGLSVFLFDYRGYGKSQAVRPSEDGLYQDALGAYDYLTRIRKIRPERIVPFGRSLGASVAGELAARKPAAALILESSFPSVEAVAKFHYGGLPVHWLLGAEFRLIDRLPQLSLPKLIIHGDKDDIIPIELGRQVFDAAKPPKEWYVIQGADHNNTYQVGGGAYFRRLADFIRKAITA